MTTIQIKDRFKGAVLFTCEAPDGLSSGMQLRHALEKASTSRANLSRANLSGANLSGANLSRANLYGADLSGANLSGADLSGANLSGANLSRANLYGADLSGANLSRANLYGADLYGADLYGADLSGADLSGANLSGANLSRANLYGADLSGANLSRANLYGAKNAELAVAKTRILPEGALIGWKKCQKRVIVKLRIPEEANRSHAFGRKCRAEFADVIEVIGAEVAISTHDGVTEYRAGQRVTPDSFSLDWQSECEAGIHFFITKAEAEAY
ncbi:pentapeptide repeat-containing protein [Variovorax sp. RKNM96]|uniref:pentapeptide repeat-containing protein n=1 Tax=Variovorax sp. RKNM96 TaxID=2681552 RepID=UPI00197F3175|nr:pentapeptide repeat-containing protein [Variovorax sp. RKNM96]